MLKSKSLNSIFLAILVIILISCANKGIRTKNIQIQNNVNTSNKIGIDSSSFNNNESMDLPNTEFIKPHITVVLPLAVIEVEDNESIAFGAYLKNFYNQYEDRFDFLAVYANFQTDNGQFGGPDFNTVKGIGHQIVPHPNEAYGTKPSPAITEAIKRWASGFPKAFEEAVSTKDYFKQ